MGHGPALLSTEASGRCRFSQETFAGSHGNGRYAPTPAVQVAIIEPPAAIRGRTTASWRCDNSWCAGISRGFTAFRPLRPIARCARTPSIRSPRSGRPGADRAMERRGDEEGAVCFGDGSGCLPLGRLLRRQVGKDLGLKDGKPRRLDAGSDRDQLGQKGQVAETRGTKTTVEAGIGAAGLVGSCRPDKTRPIHLGPQSGA